MFLLPARATDRGGKEIFREQRITRLILPEMAVPTIEIDRYRRQRLAMIEIDRYRPISSGNKAETAPIDDTAR
ncbi:hypothetical protein B296_00050804 [Ensete ventricosum]|uniref:Uncharacterized protein n=1 Tax=Ensete ventricosum TaxID=4639 RepID=A0A426YJK0_ENSVE|nr:hypothetical protein B296_00050804 [Ensete ventricosum]